MSQPATNFFSDADIISAYSRAEALTDGVLVDCTTYARQAGVRFPVALTQAAYLKCIKWDNSMELEYQDESGRAADLFTMFCLKAKQSPSSLMEFSFLAVPSGQRSPRLIHLKALIGPGDDAAPVITVMLPHED